MGEEQEAADAQTGWYCAVPGAAPAGPYDEAAMKGLIEGGYINADTSVWREGEATWEPVAQVPSLQQLLQHAPASNTTAAAAAPAPAAGALTSASAKAQSAAATVDGDDELAAFEAEIAAVEEQHQGAAAGPGTPDELEFEDDDGTWYVWDRQLRKYVDRALAAAPGMPVNEADMVFTGDDEVIPTIEAARAAEAAAAAEAEGTGRGKGGPRKRSAAVDGATASGGGSGNGDPDAGAADMDADAAELIEAAGGPSKKNNKKAKKAAKPVKKDDKPATWFELKVNTSVYVTGLPDDVTTEEIVEVFSKYGVIKEDEQGRPRVKIYTDKSTGMPKGDALVTFLKEPSVALAVQLLDGSPFRFSMGTKMTVSIAKFEMKGDTYQARTGGNKKNKKKQLEKLEKRLEWGGFDDKHPPEKVTVIIKHVFKPEEFADDLMLSEDLERDVRTECEKLGAVDKLKVFKHNPEGVVSVKFKEPEVANACRATMHGRWFGGRQLEATMYDGLTNYAVQAPKESAEEQEARLEAFAAELEGKGAGASVVKQPQAPQDA